MVTRSVKPAAKKVTVKKPAATKTLANKTIAGKAVKAVKAVKSPVSKPAPKVIKIKKPKLVRDSFTMPQTEYDVLAHVKKACIAAGFDIKKSELLRIGVALIEKMDTKKIQLAQANLTPLKAGRPSK
jgi:hypothetical protein